MRIATSPKQFSLKYDEWKSLSVEDANESFIKDQKQVWTPRKRVEVWHIDWIPSPSFRVWYLKDLRALVAKLADDTDIFHKVELDSANPMYTHIVAKKDQTYMDNCRRAWTGAFIHFDNYPMHRNLHRFITLDVGYKQGDPKADRAVELLRKLYHLYSKDNDFYRVFSSLSDIDAMISIIEDLNNKMVPVWKFADAFFFSDNDFRLEEPEVQELSDKLENLLHKDLSSVPEEQLNALKNLKRRTTRGRLALDILKNRRMGEYKPHLGFYENRRGKTEGYFRLVTLSNEHKETNDKRKMRYRPHLWYDESTFITEKMKLI